MKSRVCSDREARRLTTGRRVAVAAAGTLLAVAGTLAASDPAWAAAGYTYWGPATSYGYWDYSNVTDYLRLIAAPGTLASGKCYDQILDWNPEDSSHYDARLARSCRSNTSRDTSVSHESPHDVAGPQKLGTCYGPNQATNSPSSNCSNVIGSVATVTTKVGATEFCVRAWSMTPTGTLQYFSGGDPTQCDS